jgi:hypothetical protein
MDADRHGSSMKGTNERQREVVRPAGRACSERRDACDLLRSVTEGHARRRRALIAAVQPIPAPREIGRRDDESLQTATRL